MRNNSRKASCTSWARGFAGLCAVLAVAAGGSAFAVPTETVLHAFTDAGSDGANPFAGLIADSNGNLYGTTQDGGASAVGTVFRLTPGGTETVLYSFTGSSDGNSPEAGLIADSSGNIYGTAFLGGASSAGVVFKLTPGGTETVLHSFAGGGDGAYPSGGLIADSNGNLYGTTEYGGGSGCGGLGCGVVFKLSPGGTETVLYAFAGGADGGLPFAGLIADGIGNLYGTTASGGTPGNGVVFKLTGTGFATPPAYVTNAGSNTVTVLATPTNSVAATVTVGIKPGEVAVTPDGQHVYVTNVSDGTVSVIDTTTNTVAATIPVGLKPKGVAVAPNGKHAYVTNSSDGTVSVIKTSTSAVVATVEVGASPFGVAVTPDGTQAYVVNKGSNNVSVIDAASKAVLATVTVGLTPKEVAISPDGKHAYVTNSGSNNVSVIRTATNTVVATVTVGLKPSGIAFTPDGTQVYVTNSSDGTVSVIDSSTKTVVGTPIPVGTLPLGLAFTLDGKHAYVANEGSGDVSVIRTTKQKVVATIAVGTNPFGVGIRP